MGVANHDGSHQQSLKVAMVCEPADELLQQAPVRWAMGELQDCLSAHGISVEVCSSLDQVSGEALAILVGAREASPARAVLDSAGVGVPDVPEALALVPGRVGDRSVLVAWG
ncbi:hypothetical protein LCGC14_2045050, partial [marine sediment metagenome]